MKKAGCLVIAVLLMVGIAEVAIPRVASQIVASNAVSMAEEALGMSLSPVKSVSVRSFPAASILLGSVDSITVDYGPLDVAGIDVDVVRLSVRGLRFEPSSIVKGAGPEVLDEGEIEVEIMITEEALNRDPRVLELPLTAPHISLRDGRVRIEGTMKVGKLSYDVGVDGSLAIVSTEPRKVFFVPETLYVDGKPASSVMNATLRALVGDRLVLVDLEREGIPLYLRKIEVRDGRVIIGADIPQ